MRRLLILIPFLLAPGFAEAREQIRVVGSSTVFPFVAAGAEQFGRQTEFRTPIVESTGTGGGLKMFCDGIGVGFPDMANASRPIKPAEVELCKEHGITQIIELPLGYDGIVLANARQSVEFKLTREALFLALAREVPRNGKLVPNFYQHWNEISPKLPKLPITVYGPPPTSGTRDAFVELVMHEGCKAFPEYEAKYGDKAKDLCGMMREDGHFVEAGEDDNIIVQKLMNNPDGLGLFGYSFLEQNAARVKANPMDGVMPSFDAIVSGKYEVARSLFVYVKGEHVGKIPGLAEFARMLVSDSAVGPEGYLILKGLLPLPKKQHDAMKAKVAKL